MKKLLHCAIGWLIIIPCIIWTGIGVAICLVDYNQWFYYLAVALPPVYILLIYFLSFRFKLSGSILLFASGLTIGILILKNSNLFQSIFMMYFFSLPITASGFLSIASHYKFNINESKSRHAIFKKLPL